MTNVPGTMPMEEKCYKKEEHRAHNHRVTDDEVRYCPGVGSQE